MPKFDIMKKAEGCAETSENGVYADSAEDLYELYAMCGEQVKIIKEYDNEENPTQQPTPNINVDTLPDLDNNANIPRHFVPNTEKIITINGEKIKIVGDDVFKFEWVDYDGDDIRMISEATGRVIKREGKIIQKKDWVLQVNEGQQDD